MTYSNLIKTGLGVGLLAVSLGADATAIDGKHGFGSASIYVRSSATGTNYTSFIPSGNQSSDSVIVVEHLQGAAATSPQTWTYMVPVAAFSGLSGANSTVFPTGLGSIFSPSSTSWAVQSGSNTATSTASVSGFQFDKQGVGFVASASIATQLSSSYTNMLWDIPTPIAYPFSYSASVSSSQCNVTAIAIIDQNDYLQWGGIVAQAVGYYTASSPAVVNPAAVSVLWTSSTKSSSSTGAYTTTTYNQYMSTYAQDVWNKLQTSSISFSSFPTNATVIMYQGLAAAPSFTLGFNPALNTASTVTIGIGTSVGAYTSPASNNYSTFTTGYHTAPATMLKAQTACNKAYTDRAALNTTNLLIGGRNGLMRLW